jgi:hypothetical protein
MSLRTLARGAQIPQDLLMAIDLSQWEADLDRLSVTRAPHRLGGRVIWLPGRADDEQGDSAAGRLSLAG